MGSDGRLYFTSDRNADVALGVADRRRHRRVARLLQALASMTRRHGRRTGSKLRSRPLATATKRSTSRSRQAVASASSRTTRSMTSIRRGHAAAAGSPSFARPTTTTPSCGSRTPTAATRVDSCEQTSSQYPEWSPDGRWIAAEARLRPSPSSRRAVAIRASSPGQAPARFPTWSPDGTSSRSRRSERRRRLRDLHRPVQWRGPPGG